jgi:2-dehydro-3-deoxygluconokinase
MAMKDSGTYRITQDDLSRFAGRGPAFVTFGEVMIRDTPADGERAERTRLVNVSAAGSELTLAIGLSRLGIPSAFLTRVPRNPYGRLIENVAREQGLDTSGFVWAGATEPVGRLIYELGRTPRKSAAVYQRKYSAASTFGRGMVDWKAALRDAGLFHVSGITFGIAPHSGYEVNYGVEAFVEAAAARPSACLVGMDLNYRGTLWSAEQARAVMAPLIGDHVDVLVTTVEDIAQLYGIGVGSHGAQQIVDGDIGTLGDEDLRLFAEKVMRMFGLRAVAITLRYPDSFEQHRWESAAMDSSGALLRSAAVRPITLWDRLGGGDTWNAGFYYGIMTEGLTTAGLQKGIVVGDAFTRLKQTQMFDLPIVDKREVEDLIRADISGGGRRTSR